jgi:hypothetical protein
MEVLFSQGCALGYHIPLLRSCKQVLARQIEHTDRETGPLVYELYGLSDEEIALVEEATS